MVTVVLACAEAPSLDGARVPTIASPSCAQACDRLAALCGYAPVSCVADCTAGFDDARRSCIGQAPSCQAALESCAPEATDGGEGDGGKGDGSDVDAHDEDDASAASGARADGSDASTD